MRNIILGMRDDLLEELKPYMLTIDVIKILHSKW